MGKKRPGWLDKPELAWTPETPLRFEPKASTEFDSGDNTASTHGPKRWRNQALWRHKTTSRLTLGLMQGLVLSALLYGRDHHRWADTGFTAGLIMAMIFAPLLLIQGLGRISPRPLLIWAASVAIYLTGLGAYHHWRGAVGGGPEQAGVWLAAMVAAALFIGQSLFLTQARSRRGPLYYPALFEAAWGLGIQSALCGLCAASLWALQRAFPVVGFVVIPIMTGAVAAIAQLANRALLRRLRRPLVFALTCALPALVLLSVLMILLWSMTRWLPPFGLLALVSLAMVVSINASYRDGEWRPGWRRRMEFAAALLLLPLATLCILALQSRVAALGFTMPRVVAAALVLLLLAYALAYTGATLITLTGGRAMERLEIANLAIAFMAMSVMTAMASPLADPVRLAVAEQSWRLTHGAIAPAKFDYVYLRNAGLRFGYEALQRLHAQNPQP